MIAGDTLDISYTHPTLGNGVFFAVANTDSTFSTGTFKGDDNKSGIDGGGRVIRAMSRQRWQFKCTISWDMNKTGELEAVSALMNSTDSATFVITHVSGISYTGVGFPVGDGDFSGMSAQSELTLQGGGSLTQL